MSARDVCILTLVSVSLFIGPVVSTDAPAPATEGESRTLRVLVVGNSLSFENNGTYQVVAHLLSQQFPNTAIEAVQIAESGEFLSEHLKKAETPGTYDYAALDPESIEKWDYVILQEESEQVALGGESEVGTRDAIAGLARLAAARGARVGVVLTWAWLDGSNDKFPSFEDMQNKVNGRYVELLRAVREDTGIPVFLAPVGLAWQAVRGVLSQQAALRPSQNGTAVLANATSPGANSSAKSGAPSAALQPAIAPSPADGSSAAPALGPEVVVSAANPSAVASFLTVPKAKAAAAARQPHGEAAAPVLAAPNLPLLAAICPRRAEVPAPSPAPDLAPAGLPLTNAAVPAPKLAPAGTPPAADAPAAAAVPGGGLGLAWTSISAGRKLLCQPRSAQSRSVRQDNAVELEQSMRGAGGGSMTAGRRHRLREVGEDEAAGAPEPVAEAPAPGVPAEAPEDEAPAPELSAEVPAAEGPAPEPQAEAPEDEASGPAVAEAPVLGPQVTVPESIKGEPVRSEISLPARSDSVPFTTTPGQNVSICRVKDFPARWNTFTEIYEEDGNHPSEKGTYLEGLIIASAITGCRMLGNPYDRGLETKWVGFLQALSDAVMFETTPPAFPQELWAPNGVQCTLK